MQNIVLASGSPRRKEILELLELDFEVAESLFDEDLIKTDDPVELVTELALQKALAVGKRDPDAIVVGGDTTVTLGVGWIGKANTAEEAKEIFGSLLGKTHQVITGVAVVNSLTGERYVGHEVGQVAFRQRTGADLDKYVSEEKNWRGFAGAYALQGGAVPFAITQMGKLSAIIGMPVELTASLLEEAGVVIEVDPREVEESLKGWKEIEYEVEVKEKITGDQKKAESLFEKYFSGVPEKEKTLSIKGGEVEVQLSQRFSNAFEPFKVLFSKLVEKSCPTLKAVKFSEAPKEEKGEGKGAQESTADKEANPTPAQAEESPHTKAAQKPRQKKPATESNEDI